VKEVRTTPTSAGPCNARDAGEGGRGDGLPGNGPEQQCGRGLGSRDVGPKREGGKKNPRSRSGNRGEPPAEGAKSE